MIIHAISLIFQKAELIFTIYSLGHFDKKLFMDAMN